MSQRRIYVRDDHGRFAETGALNKKLRGVAADLSTTPNTKLAQRVTFRRHGITNPRHQEKVVNMLKAQRRSRRRAAGIEKKVTVGTGKKSYRVKKG